jgi:IclR family pca regulon transcriptional regulator
MVSQVGATRFVARSRADAPPNCGCGTVQELPDRQDFDTAFEHGLAILAALSAHDSVSSAEAAALAGLARADAHRSLQALTELGYTGFDGQRYHLQPRTLRVGVSFMGASGIAAMIARVLEQIRPSLHARISAVVLDGDQALSFPALKDRSESSCLATGSQPAHATSGGRVMLAFRGQDRDHPAESFRRPSRDRDWADARACALPTTTSEVRREEFATVLDDAGSVQSLAVPVFDETLRCICALELAVSDMDLMLPALLIDVLPELLRVSRASSGRHFRGHADACGDAREGVTWHRA